MTDKNIEFQAERFLKYMRTEPSPVEEPAPQTVAPPTPISGTLFECMYAICGGGSAAAFPPRQGLQELEERQKLAEYFRQTAPKSLKLREHRMTEADCQDILSDLMTFAGTTGRRTEHETAFGRIPCSLGLCAAYAVFHNRPIAIVAVERRSYVMFSPPAVEESETIFLQINLSKADEFKQIVDSEECARVLREYHPCMTCRKAIPALGQYKTAEWAELAAKLGISIEPKQKKADIYLAIQLFLQGLSALNLG